ncbi:sensor domain-containing protein [Paenibacillus tyrfis]|uniref:sensor domain-containing protein n=1 Tax=Paenibacillus tyrfis TaxID=1501230 RepID=UPI0020A1DAA2|nr:sensor domain-containing protein [Paenibacillus tyrfis]MCP1306693.1 sensor domain-containing protein [Paenibacillus tyrfis]
MNTQKLGFIGAFYYLLYLLPAGIIGFTLTIVGIVLSIGLMPLFVGFPLMIMTARLAKHMMVLDARLANRLLKFPSTVTASSHSEDFNSGRHGRRGLFAQLGAELSDPATYVGLLFQIVKLPLGIISFTLAVTIVAVNLALLASPLVYTILLQSIGIDIFERELFALLLPSDFSSLQISLIYAGIGLLLLPVTNKLIRLSALFFGRIAVEISDPAGGRAGEAPLQRA